MTARQRLANRHGCETFAVDHGGMKYTASIARFADGRLAEIFISSHKTGSDTDAAAKDSAVVVSIALQYGVPLDDLRRSLLRDSHGRPATPIGTALDLLADRERAP